VEELCPGDVLNVIGKGNAITRLGVSGGLGGHVLLAVSSPQLIGKQSEVGRAFQQEFPKCTHELYRVRIVECSRDTEGLYEGDLVLCVDEAGRVRLYGELKDDDIFYYDGFDEVHIWQAPSVFRKRNFRVDLMNEVLFEMRSNQQNWSWSTAVKAFLVSGFISNHGAAPLSMKELEDSWRAQPICTSIVVIFWQRYLAELASLKSVDQLDLILQYMPLRADRVLPSELLSTMLSRGWSLSQGHSGLRLEAIRCRTTTI
jgi:hypothetical protein